MKLKILSYCVLFLFLAAGVAESQTVNFRFGTHFYTWQRYDSLSTTGENTYTTHMRGYQNYLLEMNKGKWSFNTLAQTEEDIVKKVDHRGFGYRFYNLYVKGTNLFDVLDMKLGRQYITAGAGRGTIDGAYLKAKFGKNKEYQIAGYGGYLATMDYDFQNYPKLLDNFSAGGQLLYYGVKDLYVGLSYNLKKSKPQTYDALRADSLFYTKNVFVDIDSRADQLVGLDVNYLDSKHNHNFYGKAYYDINRNVFTRGEINARFSILKELSFSTGYSYREPQFSYNTVFWVFDIQNNQEIEAGFDYMLKHNINLITRVSNVFYVDGKSSLKFQLGFNHPSFGLSYIKYTGYSGESDGAYGYFNKDVVRNLLAVTSSLNYSNYRISQYSTDRVNTLTGLLGLVYRPMPQISFDLQGQFLTNRIYTFDTRVLFGFNYWLFKKL